MKRSHRLRKESTHFLKMEGGKCMKINIKMVGAGVGSQPATERPPLKKKKKKMD